jgi:hypothetical protein
MRAFPDFSAPNFLVTARYVMAAVIFSLACWPLAGHADVGPVAPCAAAEPQPAFPLAGGPPVARVWTPHDLDAGWQPPACTGWTASDFQLVIALAGRFESARSIDAVLGGFGAVSDLLAVRYWSVTDKKWQNLFSQAVGLEGPDPKHHRADFTLAEISSGKDLYFAERDNRSSSAVVYRMRVREHDSESFTVEMENVTPVRFFLVTLFPPGALQSVFFLRRRMPAEWDYYGLVRTRGGMSLFGPGSASYINRALALFYHYAGIPTAE